MWGKSLELRLPRTCEVEGGKWYLSNETVLVSPSGKVIKWTNNFVSESLGESLSRRGGISVSYAALGDNSSNSSYCCYGNYTSSADCHLSSKDCKDPCGDSSSSCGKNNYTSQSDYCEPNNCRTSRSEFTSEICCPEDRSSGTSCVSEKCEPERCDPCQDPEDLFNGMSYGYGSVFD